MTTDDSRSEGRADIEHQAAAWCARRDRGLTAAEQDEFFQWLATDPRHGEWFARHQETARGLRSLAQWRPEHGARPNPDLLEPPRGRASWSLRFTIALAAGAAFTLGLGWAAWRWSSGNRGAANPTIAVGAPLTTQRVLEDGTTVDLNHGAELEARFTPTERRVRLLRGEALFAVTKNADRPFVVEADTVEIRAVGTAFNVNLQPAAVEVLVTEGKVAVDRPAIVAPGARPAVGSVLAAPRAPPVDQPSDPAALKSPTLLGAGQRALVSLAQNAPPPHVVNVSREEIGRLLAWQPRLLEFTDTPLSQVVAEFNRENRLKLVVDDPILGAVPIGASFRSDNLEGFVRLLEASFHVTAERRGEVITLRRETKK